MTSPFAEPPWVGKYIGIPFVDRGDKITGCNCWGLVRLIYLTEAGVDLPAYGAIGADEVLAAARAFRTRSVLPPWNIVAPPYRCFDVVSMYARTGGPRVERHCGVMVNADLMVHIEKGCDAVKVDIEDSDVRYRIAKICRHEALA